MLPVKIATAGAMVAFTPDQIKHYIAGLIDGLVEGNHFDQIEHCLKDTETLASEATIAIDDFKKKDLEDILKGVEEIGLILQQLPDDTTDCVAMKPEIDRIVKWSDIFKHPAQLIQKVLVNVVMHIGQIGKDISTIAEDIDKHDDYGAGKATADLLIQNLGPVPQSVELDPETIEYTAW